MTELLLQITGVGLLLLAAIHLSFYRFFDWETELPRLSLINRQMMTVHTFFIAIVLTLMGVLLISSASLLLHSELGRRLCLGLAVFWALRLYCQLFWYSSRLWRGKRLETTVHLIFTLLWLWLTTFFTYLGIMNPIQVP